MHKLTKGLGDGLEMLLPPHLWSASYQRNHERKCYEECEGARMALQTTYAELQPAISAARIPGCEPTAYTAAFLRKLLQNEMQITKPLQPSVLTRTSRLHVAGLYAEYHRIEIFESYIRVEPALAPAYDWPYLLRHYQRFASKIIKNAVADSKLSIAKVFQKKAEGLIAWIRSAGEEMRKLHDTIKHLEQQRAEELRHLQQQFEFIDYTDAEKEQFTAAVMHEYETAIDRIVEANKPAGPP